MARGKMDQELLALSRASKHIDELEDARAQARVVTYLMMRYTSAGEQNLPSEERAKHLPWAPVHDERQMTLPGTDPIAAPTAPIAAPTMPATPRSADPATSPPVASETPREAAAARDDAPTAPTATTPSPTAPIAAPTPRSADPATSPQTMPTTPRSADPATSPTAPTATTKKHRKPDSKPDPEPTWSLSDDKTGDEEVEVEI